MTTGMGVKNIGAQVEPGDVIRHIGREFQVMNHLISYLQFRHFDCGLQTWGLHGASPGRINSQHAHHLQISGLHGFKLFELDSVCAHISRVTSLLRLILDISM